MIAVIYIVLFAGLTLYELPPLLKEQKKRDAAAFLVLMALATGLLVLLIVLSSQFGLKNYLW